MLFIGRQIKHTHLQQRKGELKEEKFKGGSHQVWELLKEELMGGHLWWTDVVFNHCWL